MLIDKLLKGSLSFWGFISRPSTLLDYFYGQSAHSGVHVRVCMCIIIFCRLNGLIVLLSVEANHKANLPQNAKRPPTHLHRDRQGGEICMR